MNCFYLFFNWKLCDRFGQNCIVYNSVDYKLEIEDSYKTVVWLQAVGVISILEIVSFKKRMNNRTIIESNNRINNRTEY